MVSYFMIRIDMQHLGLPRLSHLFTDLCFIYSFIKQMLLFVCILLMNEKEKVINSTTRGCLLTQHNCQIAYKNIFMKNLQKLKFYVNNLQNCKMFIQPFLLTKFKQFLYKY